MYRMIFGAFAVVLSLGGCALPLTEGHAPQPAKAILAEGVRCSSSTLSVDTGFVAGALASCSIDEGNRITVAIEPEDEPPINCSPWYAFRVASEPAQDVQLDLTYGTCGHRYWPKFSHDGVTWEYFHSSDVEISSFAGLDRARVRFRTDGKPLFIAGQEIVAPVTYASWLSRLEAHPDVSRFELGRSAQGRAIEGIIVGDPQAREVVVVIGRQHPPEVTGALALFPFVETILSDSSEAVEFRKRFKMVIVPMLNPDGVALGHWRHNTSGVDLNRDWGPFTQPETRLMRDLFEEIGAETNRKLRLFLDFHSTRYDTIYTLTEEQATDPPGLMDAFIADYQARLPGYWVQEEPGHNADSAVAKAWVYERFGVPTATYEIGDETDRELIGKLGNAAAEAMMHVLLKSDAPAN